jgi:hypothetical protein
MHEGSKTIVATTGLLLIFLGQSLLEVLCNPLQVPKVQALSRDCENLVVSERMPPARNIVDRNQQSSRLHLLVSR